MTITTQTADTYWAVWFIVLLTAFLVWEVTALITHHPELTLSDAIWRLESFRPHGWGWNAFRFLFGGSLILFDVWLFFHFVFHLFT